jgi:hypothetical protein
MRLFILLCCIYQVNGWFLTQSPDELLSFKTPVKISQFHKELLTTVGPMEIINFKSTEADSFENKFNIVYYELPESSDLAHDSLYFAISEEILNGMLEYPDTKLDYSNTTKLSNGYQTLFRINYSDAYVCKGLIISTPYRLAAAQCFTPKYKSLNTSVDRFLDSVSLR